MRPLIIALVAGIAVSAVVVTRAGQDPPTFRAGVQAIEVEAVVKDAQGKFVSDLTRSDFELFEDGEPQTIESLSLVGVRQAVSSPVSALALADGTVSALPGETTTPNEHFDYVVIFDSGRTDRQQKAVNSFIKTAVRPGDRVAIVETPRGVPNTLPFMATQPEMLDAVRHVSGYFCPEAKPESFWMIRDVGSRLARTSGSRKAILFVSTGTSMLWQALPQKLEQLQGPGTHPFTGALIDQGKEVRRAFEEAMRMTTINRIPVHAIDSQGLQSAFLPRDISGQSPPPSSPIGVRDDAGYAFLQGGASSPVIYADQVRELEKFRADERQSSLRLIAEETGGMPVVNTNNLDRNFTRLVETRPASYVLTYTSAVNQFNGAFHKIVVRVKRENLSVKSRRGYYAFRPGGSITPAVPVPSALSARARAAIQTPFPTSDLGAAARAASLSVGTSSASILAGVQVEDALARFDRTKPIELVWTAVADDGFGALVAVEREVVRLPAPSPGTAGSNTLVAFRRLQLPEGTYRVTAIVSQDNGPLALARSSAAVVSRPAQPYGFTDIVLSSAAPERRTVLSRKDDLSGIVPHVPSIRAEFSRSDTLEMYTEFHDVSETLTDLTLRATAIAPGGGVAWRHEEKLSFKQAAQPRGASGEWIRPDGRIIRYAGTIPLARFESGGYALRIEAIAGGRSVATSGDVPFFVNRP